MEVLTVCTGHVCLENIKNIQYVYKYQLVFSNKSNFLEV